MARPHYPYYEGLIEEYANSGNVAENFDEFLKVSKLPGSLLTDNYYHLMKGVWDAARVGYVPAPTLTMEDLVEGATEELKPDASMQDLIDGAKEEQDQDEEPVRWETAQAKFFEPNPEFIEAVRPRFEVAFATNPPLEESTKELVDSAIDWHLGPLINNSFDEANTTKLPGEINLQFQMDSVKINDAVLGELMKRDDGTVDIEITYEPGKLKASFANEVEIDNLNAKIEYLCDEIHDLRLSKTATHRRAQKAESALHHISPILLRLLRGAGYTHYEKVERLLEELTPELVAEVEGTALAKVAKTNAFYWSEITKLSRECGSLSKENRLLRDAIRIVQPELEEKELW